MDYKNLDMKLDQFITYVNDDKINLIPPFQRGHVWTLKARRKLIENIVQGRPIPAIFLYREKSGDKYEYNILDGKQRLESLILFVGNLRPSLQVKDIRKYFFDPKLREIANFEIDISGCRQNLKNLEDDLFRDFQEYVIPTIEITLSDDGPGALDEMISLFVDINQQGVQVKRFDIVKAMSKDRLLKSALDLIARRETRGKDIFYKAKSNEFTKALKAIQTVDSLRDANARVDRMWELIVELILFLRTKRHRTPVEILKSFIKVSEVGQSPISRAETAQLRKVFRFFEKAYKNKKLRASRLVRNQIHFYTMTTAIMSADLIGQVAQRTLITKLAAFGQIIDGSIEAPSNVKRDVKAYQDLAAKHTTHPGRRTDREKAFLKLIKAL